MEKIDLICLVTYPKGIIRVEFGTKNCIVYTTALNHNPARAQGSLGSSQIEELVVGEQYKIRTCAVCRQNAARVHCTGHIWPRPI